MIGTLSIRSDSLYFLGGTNIVLLNYGDCSNVSSLFWVVSDIHQLNSATKSTKATTKAPHPRLPRHHAQGIRNGHPDLDYSNSPTYHTKHSNVAVPCHHVHTKGGMGAGGTVWHGPAHI